MSEQEELDTRMKEILRLGSELRNAKETIVALHAQIDKLGSIAAQAQIDSTEFTDALAEAKQQ